MNDPISDEELIATVRSHLDRGADNLDPATLGRLRSARRTALEQTSGESKPIYRRFLLPAGAVALTSVVVITTSLWLQQPPLESLPGLETIDLLADTEDLDFYQELEFYQWLPEDELAG